jgi:hypothetical protein
MIVYGMLIITFGCMPPCAIVVCVYPFITRRRTLASVNSSNHRPYGYTPLTQVLSDPQVTEFLLIERKNSDFNIRLFAKGRHPLH